MACDCITEINKQLAERNTRLMPTIVFGGRLTGSSYCTVTLEVEKVEPKKRDRVTMHPTFCPFCGVRYVPAPVDGGAPASGYEGGDHG